MREITVEESKSIQLLLLKKVHEFCEANHLKYYLMFGSLIGAVRHKGFIPWDDDIDIAMPRKDYLVFRDSFSAPDAKFIDCQTDYDYYLPIGKVIDTRTVMKENIIKGMDIGVYIDINVIDYLSENQKKNDKAVKKLLFLRNILMLNVVPNSNKRKGISKTIHFALSNLAYFINMNHICRIMDGISMNLNPNGEHEEMAILMELSKSSIKRRFSAELFSDDRILYDFEGRQLWGPKEYNKVLDMIYKNYRELPPVENRVSHHEYRQYWRE